MHLPNYSKLLGSIIGGLVGLGLAYGLPLNWMTPEVQESLAVLLAPAFASLGTYLAPKNQEANP